MRSGNRSVRLALPLLMGAGLLSGCVSVLPEATPPSALIRLPTTPMRAADASLMATIVVHEPDAPGVFSGAEIASAEGQQIKYVNRVRWADSPARMLQEAVVDSLRATPGDGRVATVQSGVRGDYELRWSVRDLSVNGRDRVAICELRLTLVSARARQVVASSTVRASEPLSGGADTARAEALARAMQTAAGQVADFVATNAQPAIGKADSLM